MFFQAYNAVLGLWILIVHISKVEWQKKEKQNKNKEKERKCARNFSWI